MHDAGKAREKEIVCYCTIGFRSGLFAKKLEGRGIPASNLKGSLLAWTYEQGQLVDAAGESTKQVHTYGRRWALAADGYQAVYYRSLGWT